MPTTTNVIKSGLTINEVLYQANMDTDGDGTISVTGDEFIEIANVSGSTISLANVELWEDQLVHQFGAGETLAPGETYLILRQTANLTTAQATYPGVQIALASNSMNLTNGGEAIALVDTGSGDYVQWLINGTSDLPSGETGFPGTNLVGSDSPALAASIDQSIGRSPEGDDNIVSGTPSPGLYCFSAGTRIATEHGETSVEDLRIGQVIRSEAGTFAPVKWIGRQTVSTRFGPAERLMPVRIKAGAIGAGVPHTDLTVTADHGILVDGVICHAGALVNDTTITRVPLAEMGESYTVYHIETDEHEIILANGAPAETFIDNVSRRVFDNYAEFEALYGDVPEMEELPYPRAMSARQVPDRIANRLTKRQVA